MKITYYGHSCIGLSGSRRVIIDPFVPDGTVFERPDIVAVTHAHRDHLGLTEEIGACIVAPNELALYLQKKGCTTEPMNIGGTIEKDGVTITMTMALHSSWIEDERVYGGAPAGYLITMDGVTVYHAGDTGLFGDMRLIGDIYHPEVAFLPIGGRYTMGPREAMIAAEFIGARVIIPIHYNTSPRIEQNAEEFKRAIERTTDMSVILLQPGESWDCEP